MVASSPARFWLQLACLYVVAGFSPGLQAACTGDGKSGGILKLDRCDEFEANGIYSRRNQQWLNAIVIGGTVSYALWEGTESPEGRTAWKSLDSMAMAAVTTEILKNVVQRPRPSQSDNPNLWRQGGGNKSFPSGETADMAAFVTPIVNFSRLQYSLYLLQNEMLP